TIQPCPLLAQSGLSPGVCLLVRFWGKAVIRRNSSCVGATRLTQADKGRIELPQRSSLLPHRVPTRAGSAQRPASTQNNSVRPYQMRQQQHRSPVQKRYSLCGSSDANCKSNRDIVRGRKDILRSGKEREKDILRRRKDILRSHVCWPDDRPGEPADGWVHNTVH